MGVIRREGLTQAEYANAIADILKEVPNAVLREGLTQVQAEELISNILMEDPNADLELLEQGGSYTVAIKSRAQDHSFRADLQKNDFDDQGPDAPAPAPAPVPPGKVPVVSPGWAQNYKDLWQTMQIQPQSKDKADDVAGKIVSNRGRYESAVSSTSVPWWFIAVVHAMECSLNFTEHLHNGDPLSARTVRVPQGRPPTGTPPFKWEDSARDAISYEKLDKVTDWSLTSVLYHWHRYNGINNEYKTRGIPTPYLWSGSQHYQKGLYVADHDFDLNAVSGQVGAAVILKTLINIGAVTTI